MDLHIPPVVSFVLSMLFSVTAGFLMAEYGWHNGLLFLLVFVVVALTTYELREYKGSTVIPQLMPMFINTLVVVVVSALCSFAGICLGNGPTDFVLLAYYVVSMAAFGFLSTCVSVNNAAHAYQSNSASPLLTSLVVYAVAFIFGLIAVANDDGSQPFVVVGYVVFCVVLSFIMMMRASRVTMR